MRTGLLIFVLVFSLFAPVGSYDSTDYERARSPAQETSESLNLPRVYGENLALDIYGAVSYSGYRDYVREFTENGSRWALDQSMAETGINREARQYILNKMIELSDRRIQPEVVGDHHNVVGKLPGYLPGNNPAIVVTGHYDSWYISIGANEGGSGIATILELIEPLSAYEWPLDIYFIAMNSRYAQWGPFGGAEISNYFFNNQVEILAMYCVEALLVENPYAEPDERVFMTYQVLGSNNYHMSQYWADLGRVMSKNYGQNYIKPLPHTDLSVWDSSWYEHNDFIERGYMNLVVPFESGYDYDDAYRTPDDTWVNIDYRYQLGTEVTGAIGASIAYTMSREFGSPMEHDLSLEIGIFRSKTLYIPISTPTTINVTSRWFGSTTSFTLLDPNQSVVGFKDYNHTSAWETTDVFSKSVSQKGIYRLVIENTGDSYLGCELEYSYDSDIDGNGVLDSQEYWLDTALFDQDSDLDTISDALEIIYGTDLNSVDSDLDSMPDNYEIEYGFDPRDPSDGQEDADADSLTNAEEYVLGLNPWRADSDYDKIPDAWEIEYGLNPLVNDALSDPDADGKTNLDEFKDGTDPFLAEIRKEPLPWFILPAIAVVSFIVIMGIVMWRESRIMG
ncbi:MAG: M28 family peptidase [Candidatus Thorarchaeota archaeon]